MKLYSTVKAAEFLKMSVSALKYHIYTAQDIQPIKVGNSLAFTQEELYRFQTVRRSPGRPKSTKENKS